MEDPIEEPDAAEPVIPPDETGEATPRETRGVLWIVLPALAGVVVGALVELLLLHQTVIPQLWGEEQTFWVAVADGGTVGFLAGGAVGTFVWAFLPYKRLPKDPPETSVE